MLPQPSAARHLFGGFALLGGLQRVGRRASLGASCRMKAFHQPAQELGRVDSKLMRLVELGQRALGIACKHQLQQSPDAPAVGEAEHVAHLIRS